MRASTWGCGLIATTWAAATLPCAQLGLGTVDSSTSSHSSTAGAVDERTGTCRNRPEQRHERPLYGRHSGAALGRFETSGGRDRAARRQRCGELDGDRRHRQRPAAGRVDRSSGRLPDRQHALPAPTSSTLPAAELGAEDRTGRSPATAASTSSCRTCPVQSDGARAVPDRARSRAESAGIDRIGSASPRAFVLVAAGTVRRRPAAAGLE